MMTRKHTKSHLDGRGYSSRRLSNANLTLEIVPDLGARIVSLTNAKTGREWCWHPGLELRLFGNQYGELFSDGPNAGFDECFPTIVACEWRSRQLPCHGEVWCVPWTLDEKAWEKGIISTSVVCRQSPFELNRQVAISENRVLLSYHLRNTGTEAESYLWSFHPMIQVNSEDHLILPPEVETLILEGAKGSPKDEEKSVWAWPSPFPGFNLDRFELGPSQCASVKGFTGPLENATARIVNRTNGEYFEISWDAEAAPYLGVWINRGGYKGFQYVAALEPTNGQTDSLCKHPISEPVPAGGERFWSTTITLGHEESEG